MGSKIVRDRKHKIIESAIKKEKKEREPHRVLLLGCGDAGNVTFLLL
jgi:hypothetical protein